MCWYTILLSLFEFQFLCSGSFVDKSSLLFSFCTSDVSVHRSLFLIISETKKLFKNLLCDFINVHMQKQHKDLSFSFVEKPLQYNRMLNLIWEVQFQTPALLSNHRLVTHSLNNLPHGVVVRADQQI